MSQQLAGGFHSNFWTHHQHFYIIFIVIFFSKSAKYFTESGEVLSWGWNEHGNCGTGTTEDVIQSTKVNLPGPVVMIGAGAGHSLAVVSCTT